VEEALRTTLLASAGVVSLCAGRVDWGAHPQGAPLPAIVLTVIGDASSPVYTGPDDLSQGRVQVDCYAESYAAAKALARAVRAALDGYRAGGFLGVFLAGTRDGREGGTNEADRPFRVSMDFLTNWRN
jgi:hypothetical protein